MSFVFPMISRATFATFLLSLSLSAIQAREPFRPNLGPDHERITVSCGEVTLLLRQRSQWTPGRIDFRGTPMTTESSAYGTVFNFPGVGFIGTQHLENEPEELTSLTFTLDGKDVESPEETMQGDSFRFHRTSKIRDFTLECSVEVKDNRLYEETTFSTEVEVPLTVVYHFMHAWVPSVSNYLAVRDEGDEATIRGELGDGEDVVRARYIMEPIDWMAVYEPKSSQFAVSRLLEAPSEAHPISMIWNVPGTYRKYYLRNFEGKSVPAGFKGTWRLVTAFGESAKAEWEDAARELATTLREK